MWDTFSRGATEHSIQKELGPKDNLKWYRYSVPWAAQPTQNCRMPNMPWAEDLVACMWFLISSDHWTMCGSRGATEEQLE